MGLKVTSSLTCEVCGKNETFKRDAIKHDLLIDTKAADKIKELQKLLRSRFLIFKKVVRSLRDKKEECRERDKRIDELEKENEKLRKALEYYANRMGSGGRARQALKKGNKNGKRK